MGATTPSSRCGAWLSSCSSIIQQQQQQRTCWQSWDWHSAVRVAAATKATYSVSLTSKCSRGYDSSSAACASSVSKSFIQLCCRQLVLPVFTTAVCCNKDTSATAGGECMEAAAAANCCIGSTFRRCSCKHLHRHQCLLKVAAGAWAAVLAEAAAGAAACWFNKHCCLCSC